MAIQDTDFFLLDRGGTNHKVTGAELKVYLNGGPQIATPYITFPVNGAVGAGTSSGITITADTYTPLNGAGAVQTSSVWEVYKDSYPLTSTNAITAVAQNNASWNTKNSAPLTSGTMGSITFAEPNKWLVTQGTKVYISTTGPTGTYTDYGDVIPFSPDGAVATNGSGTYVAVGGTGFSPTRPAVSYSTNGGVTWSSVNTISWGGGGSDWGFEGVAYGNGTFVAVGKTADPGGTTQVWTSTNGSSWTQRTNAFTSPASKVSFANGKFFMAAGSGVLYYSSNNGITWTLCTTPGSSDSQFTNVTYGGGIYTVVNNNKPYASTDGITWTMGPTGQFSKTPRSIAYGNGIFWGVAQEGTCPNRSNEGYYSTDGLNWTKPTGSRGGTRVIFGGGVFASVADQCGGIDGTIYSSANPAGSTTLTIAGCQTDGFLVDDSVTDGGAATGTITSVNNTTVIVSPSDTDWGIGDSIIRAASSYTAVTGSPFTVSASPFTSLSIAKPPLEANTKYWARVQYATTNASAATSSFSAWSSFTTGSLAPAIATWTAASVGVGSILKDVIYDNSLFVTVGLNGTIQTSSDGVTWTARSSATTSDIYSVAWDGTRFSAYGTVGSGSTSTTGLTWNSTAFTPSNITYALAATTGAWFGLGVGNSISSANGDTWTEGGWGLPTISKASQLTYGGGKFVAVGASGEIKWSTTNTSGGFTTAVSGVATTLRSVTYAAGLYVAVGNSGVILTSPDAVTWTNRTINTVNWNGVAYGNGLYLAVDTNGTTAAYSTDGTNWSTMTISTPIGGNWNEIAYGNGKFVLVGGAAGAGQISYVAF